MTNMMKRCAALVLCGALLMTAAQATEESKKASQMLFDGKHIATLAPGTELTYKFERIPSSEKLLGAGYSDTIKVKIESEASPGKKNVVVNMFTGARALDPNRLTNMDGNPMLVVFLETALGHFQQLAGGDRSYLKNVFSRSLGDSSKMTPVKLSYKGSEVDGVKITVSPYADDPSKSKMQGFEGSEFSIILSPKVPGEFAQMIANYKNAQPSAPTLLEKMTLDGVGDVK